ncbi:hypothetical protein A3G63_01805 [Candidatus Kaiserbacteria bacterium RIFCSPLOWO2_12_FULL_52_8]|uniref:DUF5667 domain-containing protein n=1 Tax=Candidatus Kaiserbacteria bacterium RIFCSPHIGHO2_01_FULL_53_31 TaxID=1798481 RepID=A0A1F6CIK2_9BACT|nr:MAG: hypothetical protein A2678_02700 [Candidatus Kaiserbacteria bacterium RIFCSPHIGHO2_01_FULL_53_31]OGG94427.1 MAG: hypothetical protein A3G63_01805 [Candidatus Kaiserbacteria bacterium RIFCSPLOWO2_12_FULL_52_8]
MKKMKNNPIDEGIQRIKSVRLSREEKVLVLSHLNEYADAHPVAAPREKWSVRETYTHPYKYAFEFRFGYALTGILLIVLLAGGSVASAAAGEALPGDILYPVKIYINEPLIGATISGDVLKARYEASRTIRRLEEAESLVAEGRLSQSAVKTITENFEKSSAEFNSIVTSTEEKKPSEEMVDARVDFEAQISAHSQILSIMEDNAETPQKDDITSLRDVVQQHALRAREKRADIVEDFIQNTDGDAQAQVDGQKLGPDDSKNAQNRGRFESRLQSIQTMIDETESRLRDTASSTSTASSTVQQHIFENVPQTLRMAERALLKAQEKQDSGDSDEAYSALLDSESAAKEADTSLTQGMKFGKEHKNNEGGNGGD